MPKLAELQRALLQNAQATQQLEGLDDRYDRASVLRDAPIKTPGGGGLGDIFAAISGVMDRSEGRKEVRNLDPARADLRQQIAESGATREGDTLRRALGKEQRDISKFESDEETAVLRRAVNQRNLDRNQAKGETWYDPQTKEEIAVKYDKFNKPFVTIDGKNVPVPENYVPMSGRGGSGSGGYQGVAMNTIQQGKLNEEFGTAMQIGKLATTFDEGYSQIAGMPTGFANKVITTIEKQGLSEYLLDENTSQQAKDSIQWWAQWRMDYTGPARHKYFGATLTDNELAAWEEAESIMPGMPGAEIQRRLDKIHELSRLSIKRRANIGLRGRPANQQIWRFLGEDNGMLYDEATNTFNYPGELSGTQKTSPPPGTSQADYDTLDDAMKKFVWDEAK